MSAHRPARVPLRDELAEATAHGEIYVRRLRRSQMALALLALTAFGGLVGALPLVLFALPSLQEIELLGVPLPILLVVGPPFPLFVAIAWLFQRRADALDAAFQNLVEQDRP